jgi:hypothetical protein
VVKKLWREFVSDIPSPQAVRELASLWRASNYEMKPLLRAMLLSEAFWAPANRGTLVKSPVDLVIGSLRQFQFSVEDPAPFAVILRQLGQDLFAPPNVKGWPPGETWLNTTTLLARKGFLNRLFRADEMLKLDGVTAAAQAASQSTAQLIDRDMMGDGRARAQTRLAVRSGREANSAKSHGPLDAAVWRFQSTARAIFFQLRPVVREGSATSGRRQSVANALGGPAGAGREGRTAHARGTARRGARPDVST